MKKIHLILFFLFFILISVIEGIHFILDLRFLLYGVYCIPFFLFVFDRGKAYKLPVQFLLLTGVYLFSSLISVFFSREMGTSLDLFFRDISLFLILFYSHTHKEEIKEYLPQILVGLSLLFIVVSGILFTFPAGRIFIQGQRLNLLFNPAYLHKTIGDYLPFAILVSAYFIFIKKNIWYKYPLILSVIVFFLSFSRTGYIILAVGTIALLALYGKNFKKIPPLLRVSMTFNIFLFIILFLTFTSRSDNTILSYLQKNLQNILFVNVRPLLSSHLPFWIAGIKGFLLSPFTGVGAGTFEYLSYRYMDTIFLSSFTSFNLIIDILAEQGLLPTLSLLMIIIFVLIKAEKKSIFFIIFLLLISGFMGYSTYKYVQIYFLFFVVMGILIPTEKSDVKINTVHLIGLSFCAIIFLNVVVGHHLLIQINRRELAHSIYPYDGENLKVLIQAPASTLQEKGKKLAYIKQYQRYFGANAFALEFVGDSYREMGGSHKIDAIRAYEQSFIWGKYAYGNSIINRMKKLYALKWQVQGKKQALQYVSQFMESYYSILDRDPKVYQQEIYNTLYRTYFTQ